MAPIRIFVADDHAVFRSGLTALLEKEAGLQVVGEAGSGPDTIEAVSKQDVDVLILDIRMPGMKGYDVARALLQRKPDLAIVVLTMYEDEYYLQEFLKIGARAFVLKKSTGTDVLRAIRSANRGECYIDPLLAGRVITPNSHSDDVWRSEEPGQLTKREREICTHLARGLTNSEIADILFISKRTVETHRANIMKKVKLRSRADLVRFAIENGLLRLE